MPLFLSYRSALLGLTSILSLAACAGHTSESVSGGSAAITEPRTTKLTSSDGHDITVSSTPRQIQVDGYSTTHTASNVTISVDRASAASAVRAVVIDRCFEFGSHLFDLVDTCDLTNKGDGTFQASLASCAQTQKADNVDDRFPDILVDYSTASGDAYLCAQQIAVVIDGNWLTDPVNGTHNFNFQLPDQ